MSIQNKRIKASNLAQRSSDGFRETYGHSPLESIAPFERDEIILGRRVGSGSFSSVYEIQDFNLRSHQSEIYTKEQVKVKKREETVKSVKNGARYVMKCLKDKLEDSDHDEGVFLCAAQDIAQEAEMLAALSHPNIAKLHGVVASRHTAFLNGASQFFIIMERLDRTLADKIGEWAKEKNSFTPSSSFKTLRSRSFLRNSSRSIVVDEVIGSATSVGKDKSLDSRLRVAASLASAVDYLHSEGVIFRDLKPDNVGFDRQGNLKLFDFGLARFMPRHGDKYEDVHTMSGTGTLRYTAPEVMFQQPYNLKADVYSFSAVLWELLSLKKPFAKYKEKVDFEKALLRVDFKPLVINRRWPQSVQDILERGSSRDLWSRPTMSEVCTVLDECAVKEVEGCDSVSGRSTSSLPRSKSTVCFSRLPSRRDMQKLRSSFGSFTFKQTDLIVDFPRQPKLDSSAQKNYKRNLSDASETTTDTTLEEFLTQVGGR